MLPVLAQAGCGLHWCWVCQVFCNIVFVFALSRWNGLETAWPTTGLADDDLGELDWNLVLE